jgi:hypothetical protein
VNESVKADSSYVCVSTTGCLPCKVLVSFGELSELLEFEGRFLGLDFVTGMR